ncbi:hypothetical protein [Xanthomonas campestris]|uniref:hypothetical protein n=1 Tax=Xanthomonas campestris TaxID=339 RepID=UPI00388CF3B4
MAKKSSKTAKGTKPSATAKTSAASQSFNDEIAELLELASSAPLLKFPELKSAAKLFELAIVAELLLEYRLATKGTVRLVQPTGGPYNTFAGAPASANKRKFAWFELRNAAGHPQAEVWVSVQFVGLSAHLAAQQATSGIALNTKASSHELDISLIAPELPGASPRLYPGFEDVLAAVSVKHVSRLKKESIREALGFRRELGLFTGPGGFSTCKWLQADVPCFPPSPLILASSAANFEGYDGHIDQLGLYTRYIKFPY